MACDGYKEPNPAPQTQPQLPVLSFSDVEVENELTATAYNLTDLVNTGNEIELARVTCDKLGEGYNFDAQVTISNNDFLDAYEVPVSSMKLDAEDIWVISINPQNLSDVYHENISWSNDQAEVALRYNLTTTFSTSFGNQIAYVGGSDKFFGPYKVTFTPVEASVHYTYLYTPGAANNWNQGESQPLYSENENGPFNGYAILSPEGFKFTTALDWNGTNYGMSDEEGILSTDGEAGNLTVDEYGLYYCDVNTVDLNYSVTYISTIGLIGSACPNGWDASVALNQEDYLTWTGEVYLIPGEYKFRANNEWDVNLGGDPAALTQGGDNIVFHGEEGTYMVTLDLKNIPYSCKIQAK